MPIEIGGESLVEFSIFVFDVMNAGVILSAFALLTLKLLNILSRFTHIERVDPTVFMRQFEAFFDAIFEPVGLSVADKSQSPWVSQLSFHFSIGIAVLLSSVAIFYLTAGIAIGSTLATHMAFGIVIDPVPTFRLIVALVVIGGLSVMSHASERASHIAVRNE